MDNTGHRRRVQHFFSLSMVTLMNKILCLSGLNKTGKTSTANLLASEHDFICLALADRPKELLSATTGLNFFDDNVKDKHRNLLQHFAESMKVYYDPEIWIKYVENEITALQDLGQPIAVVDVRYDLEANFFKERGAYMVYLECEPNERARRMGIDVKDLKDDNGTLHDYPGFDLIVDTTHSEPKRVVEKILNAYL